MARKVLGKGLGALIKKNEQPDADLNAPKLPESDKISTVSIDEISPCPFQPRRRFPDEQIAELALSIQQRGLIQPLAVRRVNGKLELIAGERRLRAARKLGMTEIRVVVHEASDLEVAELTLIENIQREDLSPIEEAEQYKLLQQEFGLKQEVIAKHVGKTRSVVANTIRLLELQEEVRHLLIENAISVGHAKVLLQLKDATQQIETAQKITSKRLTVRQTEQIVKSLLNPQKPSVKPLAELPAQYAIIRDQLSQDLGAKVNIILKSKNQGTIEIPYLGKDDLTRILEILGIDSPL